MTSESDLSKTLGRILRYETHKHLDHGLSLGFKFHAYKSQTAKIKALKLPYDSACLLILGGLGHPQDALCKVRSFRGPMGV